MAHMVQYAFVGDRLVIHTEALTDMEVRARAGRAGPPEAVERYNRCPECEAWTTQGGRLRAGLDCPAVREALAREG